VSTTRRQHFLIDRENLVWQWFDLGRMHRQQWVEQVGELNAPRFREQPKKRPVRVKCPTRAFLYKLQCLLVVSELQFGGNFSSESPIGQANHIADPLDINHDHVSTGCDTSKCASLRYLFQAKHKVIVILRPGTPTPGGCGPLCAFRSPPRAVILPSSLSCPSPVRLTQFLSSSKCPRFRQRS
jgi:hypothetical protein